MLWRTSSSVVDEFASSNMSSQLDEKTVPATQEHTVSYSSDSITLNLKYLWGKNGTLVSKVPRNTYRHTSNTYRSKITHGSNQPVVIGYK